MAGFTQAEQQATLDARFPTTGATDHVAYSVNGTSEFSGLARTPVGGSNWGAATAVTPSVKANIAGLTSAAASGNGAVSHFAVYSALTAGVQRTDWTALSSPKTVGSGDQLTWAAGALAITLD